MGNPEHYLSLEPLFKDDGAPHIHFTDDDEANRMLGEDANAFLIGVVLDQQIAATKAFTGPAVLRRRLGHFDPARIAAMPQDEFITVFREKPAVHRFPASMGKRVHDACTAISSEFDNNAANIWNDHADAKTVMKRLGTIPGIGKTKQSLAVMLLGRYYGIELEGWREAAPIDLP